MTNIPDFKGLIIRNLQYEIKNCQKVVIKPLGTHSIWFDFYCIRRYVLNLANVRIKREIKNFIKLGIMYYYSTGHYLSVNPVPKTICVENICNSSYV